MRYRKHIVIWTHCMIHYYTNSFVYRVDITLNVRFTLSPLTPSLSHILFSLNKKPFSLLHPDKVQNQIMKIRPNYPNIMLISESSGVSHWAYRYIYFVKCKMQIETFALPLLHNDLWKQCNNLPKSHFLNTLEWVYH